MKVFTSYFGNVNALERCGVVPISIARWSPRGWSGLKLTWLAPTSYMLSDACSMEEYVRQYEEICKKIHPDWLLRQLQQMGGGKDVALLCFERPGDFCHRHMLADYLNKLGWDVKEFNSVLYSKDIAAESVPQEQPKKEVQQLSLFD